MHCNSLNADRGLSLLACADRALPSVTVRLLVPFSIVEMCILTVG